MYHQLKKKHHIEIIGPELLEQLNFFTNGSFLKDHFLSDDRYVKVIGSLLSERINMFKGDLVFLGDLLFQPLNINIPYIYISDLIYEQVRIHIRPSDKDIISGIQLEKQLLDISSRIIYCTEWIKNKAVEFYNVDPNKIGSITFDVGNWKSY